MVNVISLLESALVMKGFKGLIVLVRFVMKYNNLLYKFVLHYYFDLLIFFVMTRLLVCDFAGQVCWVCWCGVFHSK